MPDNLKNSGYGDNFGGVARLWILPVVKATDLITALGHNILPDDSILEALFTEIELVPETTSYSKREADSTQGNFFEIDIEGRFYKIRTEINDRLASLGTYLIAVVQDNNGLREIAGGKNNPLKLLKGIDTGMLVSDTNIIGFSIKGVSLI